MERRFWDGEEEERARRRERARRAARLEEHEVPEPARGGDWRETEPYYTRREDPGDRRYRGGPRARWEREGGYPLGGYPHGLHWHGRERHPEEFERVESVEPRRWPEGEHAPWEDRAWWEQQRERELQAHAEHEHHLDRRIAEGIRRFFRRERGPHAGKGPKGYRRSDERIREDICDRIAHWGLVDATDVDVRVEDGEVTLTGTVHSRRDKRALEDVVEDVTGVLDVHNRLRVRRGGPEAPERERTS